MKVKSPQVVWQAEVKGVKVRAVLLPKEVIEFEYCEQDATGEEAWQALLFSRGDTAELRRDAEHRFMLDLLIDINQKQKEIVKLTDQRADTVIREETEKDLEARLLREIREKSCEPPKPE